MAISSARLDSCSIKSQTDTTATISVSGHTQFDDWYYYGTRTRVYINGSQVGTATGYTTSSYQSTAFASGTKTITKTHSTQKIPCQARATGETVSGYGSSGDDVWSSTYYVTVKPKTSYKYKFDANGGTLPSALTGEKTKWHGEAYYIPSAIPTRTNYTFLGWAPDNPSKGVRYTYNGQFYDKENTPKGWNDDDSGPYDWCGINRDLTLYAVWKENKYSYTWDSNLSKLDTSGLEWNATDGWNGWSTDLSTNAIKIQQKNPGETPSLCVPQISSRWFDFIGWSKKQDSMSDVEGEYYENKGLPKTETWSSNISSTFYAIWNSKTIEFPLYHIGPGPAEPDGSPIPTESVYFEYGSNLSFKLYSNEKWRAKSIEVVKVVNPAKNEILVSVENLPDGLDTYTIAANDILKYFETNGINNPEDGIYKINISYGKRYQKFSFVKTDGAYQFTRADSYDNPSEEGEGLLVKCAIKPDTFNDYKDDSNFIITITNQNESDETKKQYTNTKSYSSIKNGLIAFDYYIDQWTLDVNKQYSFEIVIRDKSDLYSEKPEYKTYVKNEIISQSFFTMDFANGGKGIGIGCSASKPQRPDKNEGESDIDYTARLALSDYTLGKLDVRMNTDFKSNVNFQSGVGFTSDAEFKAGITFEGSPLHRGVFQAYNPKSRALTTAELAKVEFTNAMSSVLPFTTGGEYNNFNNDLFTYNSSKSELTINVNCNVIISAQIGVTDAAAGSGIWAGIVNKKADKTVEKHWFGTRVASTSPEVFTLASKIAVVEKGDILYLGMYSSSNSASGTIYSSSGTGFWTVQFLV